MKVIGFLLIFIIAFVTPVVTSAQSVMDEIAQSHIKANVPEQADFYTFMERDLKAYFANKKERVLRVTYELLRDGPTQTGVAYPKFYLWVTVADGEKIVDEGAVRVAAIEKKRFEVTHFLSVDDIKTNPQELYAIFPPPVCEIIWDIVNQAGRANKRN